MRSLDPKVHVIWLIGVSVLAIALGLIVGAVDHFLLGIGRWVAVATFLVVGTLGTIHTVLRYRIWGFEVQEDAIYIERGVVTRVRTVVPFVRLQHVDTQRGPIERAIGLSRVVIYTAGSRQADVAIPGLTPDDADDLQERLRELAIASEYEDAL